MKPSKHIWQELQDIAPSLAALDKKNFYQVSEDYFQDSSVRIIGLVEDIHAHATALPPMLAAIPRQEQHIAPEGYFTSFGDTVMARIHAEDVAEELSYAAPLLTTVGRRQAHSVPANYFEVFPMMMTRLTAREDVVYQSPIAQQISRWRILASRAFSVISRPHYTFAMACTVALVVVLGVHFTHSTLTPEEKIFAQMQQVPDSELHLYMGRHRDDFDERTILHHINDIEFTHYQDKTETMPDHIGKDIKAVSDDTSEDIID